MEQERPGSIDLNAASVDTLRQLSGVGEVLSQRIVDARPFDRVDDLTRVKGIGASFVERLRPFVGIALPEEAALGPEESTLGPEESTLGAGESTLGPEEGALGAEENAFKPEESAFEPEESALGRETIEVRKVPETVVLYPLESEPEQAQELELEPAPVSEPEQEQASELEPEPEAQDVDAALSDEGAILPDADGEKAMTRKMDPVPAPEEKAPSTKAPPKPRRPAVTRARVRWMALLSIVLATLLATLLSLALLSYVNGGQLQYVTPDRFSELSARAEGLEAQADVLIQDVVGLRKRLDNLEALSGRLGVVEEVTEQTAADLNVAASEIERLAEQAQSLQSQAADLAQQAEEVEARVETLEAQGARARAFLEGLAELMHMLFPPEESQP